MSTKCRKLILLNSDILRFFCVFCAFFTKIYQFSLHLYSFFYFCFFRFFLLIVLLCSVQFGVPEAYYEEALALLESEFPLNDELPPEIDEEP